MARPRTTLLTIAIAALAAAPALAQPAATPAPATPAPTPPDHHHATAAHRMRHTATPAATGNGMPVDHGPYTPQANGAYQGGGMVLEGAPGAPPPTPQPTPPGQTPAGMVPPGK